MVITPTRLPDFIQAIETAIKAHEDEVTALDLAIGDGDHVVNLLRGIAALTSQSAELAHQDWPSAWQKIGMTLMSKVGGASGSLLGTLFITMGKSCSEPEWSIQQFADAFVKGVDAMKARGKSDVGEKTMLDVLVPVAHYLQTAASSAVTEEQILKEVAVVAEAGVESTRDMLATKGRASFLGERAKGHLDAGAKTCQLMVCTVANVLT